MSEESGSDVVGRIDVQDISTRAAGTRINQAIGSVNLVIADIAGEEVDSNPAVDRIIAISTKDLIISIGESIRSIGPADEVVSGSAQERIVAAHAENAVISVAAHDKVIGGAASNHFH